MCKLLQDDRYLEREIFRILLKHVSDHLSVLFNTLPKKIAFRRGCCPVNLLHIFRIPFSKIVSGGLPLNLKTHEQ